MKHLTKYFVGVSLFSLVVAYLCGCSGGGDATRPTVVSTTPANEDVGVEVSDPILVVFSEEMAANTITDSHFVLASASAAVSTSVSYDQALKTATIHHAGDLENSTEYTVTVSGQVSDTTGNYMGDDYSFTFTTASLLIGALSWSNPLPQGNALNGVWSVSASDVFAVGNVGMIVHSDGTTWTVMDSNTAVDLKAVWGSSSDDVYAVGSYGVIMRYDGTAWSLAYLEPEGSNLYSIWGSSASDVFVGSDDGIIHWDGAEWTAMTLPEEARVLSIFGFSGDDVYATDSSSRVLRYDGTGWSVFKDFYGDTLLRAIWGALASDIYAGGYSPFLPYHLYHYDGSSWSIQEDVNTGVETIWGSSSNDVYAAGTSGYMVHYDGSAWSDVSHHYVEYRFINGTSANDVYAVGDYGLIEHNDGNSWDILNGTYIWSLYDVFGIAADDIYAVGESGTVLHYDGASWERLDPLVESRNNYGIGGTAANNIYVVNCLDDLFLFEGGDIYRYDGANWNAVVEDPLVCFRSVWVSDDDNVFAVGYDESHEGWLYRYDGAAWQSEALQSIDMPKSVSGSSKENVIAVGSDGAASIFDGTSWSAMNTGSSANINSVIVFSETEAYAVDENGLLLSYDGNADLAWTVKVRASTRPITKIWGTSGEDLFMIVNVYGSGNVGGMDVIMHYDGSEFSQIESIADKNLQSAWGPSGSDVYFVGNDGVILRYVK